MCNSSVRRSMELSCWPQAPGGPSLAGGCYRRNGSGGVRWGVVLLLLVVVLGCSVCVHAEGEQPHPQQEQAVEDGPHYINKWAVHVPEGEHTAQRLADHHGFHNHGQIGSLEGYYLFEHQHVHKRSADPAHHHHLLLHNDHRVKWTEQQVNKIRKKRDFVDLHPRSLSKVKDTAMTFNDPLYNDEWYLHGGGAHGGYDMNVLPVWKKGITGKGVVVSILDDGIERNHTDLRVNYSPEASWDINSNDDDPMPRYDPYDENRHGTRCAGEVAAQANNSKCIVGIAYNARVGGVRMLDGGVSDYVEAQALSLNPQVIDVYSASWGPDDNGKVVDGPASLAKQAFINGVLKGRNGKGSIFVWASGNGGSQFDSCNCDGYTNSIFTLSISSVSIRGTRPWYLEECSSTLATTYSSGENFKDKKIITTDLHDRCTDAHTGTSASAPLAAGICALALEANPSLTWRDMQYIVMLTSRPEPLVDGEWITNGVGRKVSQRYGYGLMDAAAIVEQAEKWNTVPLQRICTSDTIMLNQEIGSDGLSVTMGTDGCEGTNNYIRYLEHVQAKISLRYSQRGDIQLTLVSPNGTRSVMLPKRKKDTEEGAFIDWPFMSVHFWGENPDGKWTLEIQNMGSDDNHGVLLKWQLILYGVRINPLKPHKNPSSHHSHHHSNDNVYAGVSNPDHVSNYLNINPQEEQFDPSRFDVGWSNGDSIDGGYYTGVDDVGDGDGVEGAPGDGGGGAVGGAGDGGVEEQQEEDATAEQWYNYVHNIQLQQNSLQSMCHPECSIESLCSGPTADDCEQCRNYRIATTSTCVTSCPVGSFVDDVSMTCHLCPPPCQQCGGDSNDMTGVSSVTCLSCIPQYYFIPDEAACVLECPMDSYPDPSGVCVQCSDYCIACSATLGCTACQDGYELSDHAQCVRSCGTGYYLDITYNCSPCDVSCSQCTGSSPSQCITCSELYSYQNGSCVADCTQGYYLSDDQLSCISCYAGCGECYGPAADQCYQCLGTLQLIDGSCINQCPPGSYYDAELERCESCDISCDQCIGPQDNQCIICQPGLFLWSGQCMSSCPQGFYQPIINTPNVSTTASSSIAVITDTHDTDITQYDTDNPGTNSDTAQPRVDNHGLGSGTDRHGIAVGSAVSSTGSALICFLCDDSCLECSGPEPNQCLLCDHDRELVNGRCIADCRHNEYYSPTMSACLPCDSSCLSCHGASSHECDVCHTSHYLSPNNECVRFCPSMFYPDHESSSCEKCPLHCERCSNSSSCVLCVAGYILRDGQCLSPTPDHSNCLHGQYLDTGTGECSECAVHCETCLGPGPKQCLTCVPPHHMQADIQQCVMCCTKLHRHGCCNCHPTTGVCMSDRNIDDGEGSSSFDLLMVTSNSGGSHSSKLSLSNLSEFASTRHGFVAVVLFFCAFSVVVFVVIFGFLQAKTKNHHSTFCALLRREPKYQPVPMYYHRHNDKVVVTSEDLRDEDDCYTTA